MRTIRRQLGFYTLGMSVAAPLWFMLASHPLFPVAWAGGVTFGFLVSWLELNRFDRAYRKALMKAVIEMPHEVGDLQHEELSRLLRTELLAGKPLMKLNRLFGFIQGRNIQRGVMGVIDERDRTRPLFRPLDFGKWGIWF